MVQAFLLLFFAFASIFIVIIIHLFTVHSKKPGSWCTIYANGNIFTSCSVCALCVVLYVMGGERMGDESQNPIDSYQALIDRHSLLVYRLAYMRTGNTYDADDIYQEVFLRCVRAKPKFRDEEHERAFLIRVTVNVSKNLLKSAWRRRTVPLLDQAVYMQDLPLQGECDDLKAALQALPKKSRTIIHLHYFENMTAEEIAKVLRIPASSVRVDLSRTRKKLKMKLMEEEALANV
jgi:RNA polymerase sigma-70 factor (ECF subfamily)